jgi:hypothetical protein
MAQRQERRARRRRGEPIPNLTGKQKRRKG